MDKAFTPASVSSQSPAAMRALASEIRISLGEHILNKWYPASIDRVHGGFLEGFGPEWQPRVDLSRSIVYQSRLTWVAAKTIQQPGIESSCTAEMVGYGLHFLRERLWDAANGGFHWAIHPSGDPVEDAGKHSYGIAFGIYACSEAFRATADPEALLLAMQAFRWLDDRAHDTINGGYYEALDTVGRPVLSPPGKRPVDQIGTRYGLKSMNTHIHLLEAFANLYAVWPDPLLRSRLQELLVVVRDRVNQPEGYLAKYLKPDWTVEPSDDSYGHDTETAFLLVEGAEVLGETDDDGTWSAARSLVDHALLYGYDKESGGFFEEGPVGVPSPPTHKIWWEQAEGLNALLLIHERFGRGDDRYWNAFLSQWRFIVTHQLDHKNGGWYSAVAADGSVIPNLEKSDAWTDPYHQARALITVAERLDKMINRSE